MADAPDDQLVVECPECSHTFSTAAGTFRAVCPSCAEQFFAEDHISTGSGPAEHAEASCGTGMAAYQIEDEIASGGGGIVYRARNAATGGAVALKVLHRSTTSDPRSRRRFKRECKAAQQLEHENIVGVFDFGEEDGKCYLAMELVEGIPLDRFAMEERLRVDEIVEMMITVCGAVDYAHSQGVIHRDLKPANILVDYDGVPRVLDFGLAKFADSVSGTGSRSLLTQEGDFLGTLAYMSPEQAAGQVREIDRRSDVYALGVILFQLVTRRLPFEMRGNNFYILDQIRKEAPARPSEYFSQIDATLEGIILKCLSKSKEERYASAAELAGALQSWLASGAKAEGVRRPKGLRPKIAVAAVLAVCLVGAGLGLLHTLRSGRTRAGLASGQVGNTGELTEQIKSALDELVQNNPGVDVGQIRFRISAGEIALWLPPTPNITDISALSGLPLYLLDMTGTKVADLSPLRGMPLRELSIDRTPVEDLNPLRGAPLTVLTAGRASKLRDLSPLQGMKLKEIRLEDTAVTDIGPLRGMALERISLQGNHVSDIAPLRGMPIKLFNIHNASAVDANLLREWPLETLGMWPMPPMSLECLRGKKLRCLRLFQARLGPEDLSIISELPLDNLGLPNSSVTDLDFLKNMKVRILDLSATPIRGIRVLGTLPLDYLSLGGCDELQDLTALVGCRDLRTLVLPDQCEDIGLLKKLPNLQKLGYANDLPYHSVHLCLMPVAEFWKQWHGRKKPGDQRARVRSAMEKLVRDNPGIRIADVRYGDVSYAPLNVHLPADKRLTDISALKDLSITHLSLMGTGVKDLWPLRGMPLMMVNIMRTEVEDLRPLQGAPLQSLYAEDSALHDLAPLRGMPLATLNVGGTNVSNLTPLAGMRLQSLDVKDTKVADLSALRGMPLTRLALTGDRIRNLSPLKNMPLKILTLWRFQNLDVELLSDMPLEQLELVQCKVANLDFLRGKKLTRLMVSHNQLSPEDLSIISTMPLRYLDLQYCNIRDLTFLKNKEVETLILTGTPIEDISVLRTLPLRQLALHRCKKLKDLTPLAGCTELVELDIPKHITEIGFLKKLPKLQKLGYASDALLPVAEFWKQWEADKAAAKDR